MSRVLTTPILTSLIVATIETIFVDVIIVLDVLITLNMHCSRVFVMLPFIFKLSSTWYYYKPKNLVLPTSIMCICYLYMLYYYVFNVAYSTNFILFGSNICYPLVYHKDCRPIYVHAPLFIFVTTIIIIIIIKFLWSEVLHSS